MVKVFFVLITILNIAFADVLGSAREFMDKATYSSQRNLLSVLFAKKSDYVDEFGKVDSLKVLKVLKKNKLLNLTFDSPKLLNLSFDTFYSPVLAMKIVNTSLESLGFNDYLVNYVKKNGNSLNWSISINTQNVVDPILLSDILLQRNCKILSINKQGEFTWRYELDFSNSSLKSIELEQGRRVVLGKPNKPYWFNVSGFKEVFFQAHNKDNWFALITFFDKDLHVIKQINQEEDVKSLHVQIPQNVVYLKVEDRYLLDNIKRGLVVRAE